MSNQITVVTIGPDDPSLLTRGAEAALRGANKRLLRTGRHGVGDWLLAEGLPFDTLDALYDGAEDFAMLNARAAQAVLAAAAEGAICYAVPDPATDATVAALRDGGASLRVIAGVSQAQAARASALESTLSVPGALLTMPAVDFLAGHLINPDVPLLLTELDSALLAGEVKLRLLEVYPEGWPVHLDGRTLPLETMDREGKRSHLSSVYIPQCPIGMRRRYTFGDLLHVMRRLRRPGDGCPWDREQTHDSLRPYVIEEAYELVDAIDGGDMDRVCDELGDVLLQVVFHARVAKEHGDFDILDVTTAICHKMITRHAHIFGDVICETSDDVLKSWDAIKRREKGLKGTGEAMRDITGGLPALMRAGKVQQKAKQAGFDWNDAQPAVEKVREEAAEVLQALSGPRDALEMELGDLLFSVVNVARLLKVEPEVALGRSTEKFITRFEKMEAAIQADGGSLNGMSLIQMDAYWDRIKKDEGP